MNLTTSTVRRSDQPVQIGSRHGYRIDGDSAYINAELSVPPYHPGGEWALELWASEFDYQGGEPSGVKVSEVQFDLPTPIAPHTHRVEAQAPARLPLQGVAHSMLLALVERSGGERRVHDVAGYPELETFPAPHFEGDVGYEIRGHEVMLQAAIVANPRAAGNLSGTLSIELWATPVDSAEAPETGRGHCLGAAQLEPVAGGERAYGLGCRAAFSEPPAGSYRLELLLREWTRALGYLTRDRRAFELGYELGLEVPVAAAEAVVELAEPVIAREQPAVVLPESEGLDDSGWDVIDLPAAELPKPAVVAAAAVELPKPAVVAAKPAVVEAAAPVPPKPAVVAAKPEVVAPKPELVAAKPAVVAAPAVAVAKPVLPAPPAAKSAPAAVQAEPVARTNSRAVSIQTASVEELARVKGLNLKIAKEIVKARPFASLEELVKVQGIGRKTFDKIRSLVTL